MEVNLLIAAWNGKLEEVEVCLLNRANCDYKNRRGETALIIAAQEGHVEVVSLLLRAGADLEAANYFQGTALMMAAREGHAAVAEVLLEGGANIEASANEGITPIIDAAGRGRLAVVALLLGKGANVEAFDSDGNTALINAAAAGHLDVITLLLYAGADIDRTNHGGRTALMHAAIEDHFDAVDLLTSRGADRQLALQNGSTVLDMAVEGSAIWNLLSSFRVPAASDSTAAHDNAVEGEATQTNSGVALDVLGNRDTQHSSHRVTPYPLVVSHASDTPAHSPPPPSTSGPTSPSPSGMAPSLSDEPTSTHSRDTSAPLGIDSGLGLKEQVSPAQQILIIPRSDCSVTECKGCEGVYSLYEGSWKGTAVAVKVLRCEINSSDAEALEAELTVLSQLKHCRLQNLLGVCHELSVLEGTVALIMEAMGRGSLYDILHDYCRINIAPLNKCNRLRLAFDISDGMRFLHSLNIVHGDLKSSNVIVDYDGRAKIADFGMKSLTKQTWSHSRNMVSTLAWTAPEVMEHSGVVQLTADVYSFGVILLELSTGQIPWEGKSAQQIMRSHIDGDRLTMMPADEYAASPVEENAVSRCLGEVSGRPSFNELYEILSLLLSSELGKKASYGSPPSDAFLCPIGYDVMEDPVICSDGHTYERGNIEKWLLNSTRSPKTNLMLANRILIPNIVLRGLIRDSQHYAARR